MPCRVFTVTPGERFGRRVVLGPTEKRGNGRLFALCRCDCGHESFVQYATLAAGKSKRCPDCSIKAAQNACTKHGHGGTNKGRTYAIWCGMRSRCNNPNRNHYENYGGRGISVCDRWADYKNFLADMGEAPAGMSLDRYPNPDGNYEPGNCRWATAVEQSHNSRSTKFITLNGITRRVGEWESSLGLSRGQICLRLKGGWSLERALTTGPMTGRFDRHSGCFTLPNGEKVPRKAFIAEEPSK